MILGLKVGNTFLDIEGSIRYEIINEIFSVDVYQSDWTFPFDLRATPKNLKALGFSNMIEVADKVLEFTASIYIGTERKDVGKLILQAASNNQFKASLASGLKALSNADTKIKDLPFINPDTSDNTIVLADTEDLGVLQTVDYQNIVAFPPHINSKFCEANTYFNGIVNKQDADTGFYKFNTYNTHNLYSMVPWVYLFYILDTILDQLGLTGKGSFYEDETARRILLYHNRALDMPEKLYCVATSNYDKNLAPGGGVVSIFTVVLNSYSDPHGIFYSNAGHASTDGDHLIRYNFYNTYNQAYAVPNYDADVEIYNSTTGFVLYSENFSFIGGVPQFGSIETVANLAAGDVITIRYQKTYGPGGADETMSLDSNYFYMQRLEDIANVNDTIVINEHVPDMTVSELFAEMKKFKPLKYSFDFDQGTMNMDYVADTLNAQGIPIASKKISDKYEILFGETEKGFTIGYDFGSSDELLSGNFRTFDKSKYLGSVDKLSDRPSPTEDAQTVLVKNSNVIYFSVTTGGGFTWGSSTDNYYKVVSGTGEKESLCKLAPMMMRIAENSGSTSLIRTALMPAIEEAGSSIMHDQGENAPSIRMMYLRGINPNTTYGGTYLLASSTPLAIHGDVVGEEYLKFNDDDGIYKEYFEALINALVDGQIIEREIFLDQGMLTNGVLKKKMFFHNMNWLLKTGSVGIEGNKIKISKGRFIRV